MSLEEFKADEDWQCAFYEAFNGTCKPYYYDDDVKPPQPIDEVIRVIAQTPGQNDEDSWIAIVEMNREGDRFVVVDVWCGYTGWECQAGGTAEFYPSEAVAKSSLTPEQAGRLGLPHDANTGAGSAGGGQ